MELGEIGRGPLFADEGTLGARLKRRGRGVVIELTAFVVATLLLPFVVAGAAIVDLVLAVLRRKPMTAVRLVLFGWWFLFTEVGAMVVLVAIWLGTAGPLGRGSMRRRRGVYWLRPRWARSHLGAFKTLFGLRIEVEGLEVVRPGPAIVMIRHASIVDNLIGDTTIALQNGLGIRYVIKRELENIPVIDIGGRWVTTSFINRGSGDAAREIARLIQLADEIGPAELVMIYPEGTRATPKKVARAKQIVRERQPELAPLADRLVHLLPPRLTGPLALLEVAPEMDVIFCGHAGFDGFEHVSDIWQGGLNGAEVRIKLWRIAATEIPTDEQGRTEWLYGQWLDMDEWVGRNRVELGIELEANAAGPE